MTIASLAVVSGISNAFRRAAASASLAVVFCAPLLGFATVAPARADTNASARAAVGDAAGARGFPGAVGQPQASSDALLLDDPDKIFARAKAMWRTQAAAPFVSYSLLERYSWRDRVHDNWWRANFRARDRALALSRTVVAEQETARLKGSAIGLDLHWHHAPVHADSLDTNASADAFPILDPLIEPDASFGFARRNDAGELAVNTLARIAPATTPGPGAFSGADAPPGAASTPAAQPVAEALREVGRVEVVARDYRIALAGVESLRYGDAYHLTLQPLHDPKRYRLRDLWVSTDSFATQQLSVEGLFSGKPYDEALWTVTYVPFGGAWYVSQVKTADTLRFGMDRYVSGLEFDFVQYAFPDDVPDMTFTRYAF